MLLRNRFRKFQRLLPLVLLVLLMTTTFSGRVYGTAAPLAAPPVAHSPQAVSSTLVINEIDYDQPSTDTAEFVELKNVSGGSLNLSGYDVVFVNGASGGAAIYDTIALPAVNLAAGAYFVICANAATVANCDLDDGPDTNFIQNGVPDAVAVRLSGVVVDTVSYGGDTSGGYTEGSGAGLLDSTLAGEGISRCPDGVDTDVNNVDFALRPITPGAANDCPVVGSPNVVINEIDYDQPSSDTAEFIELTNTGTAPANLDAYSLDFINGNLGGAVSYRTFDLPNVNLAVGAYYVICGNAATVANCDLDVSPDTDLIQNGAPDAVALLLSGVIVDTVSYEGDTGAPYTEGSGVGLVDTAAGAESISRCPDGSDTNVNNVDFSLRAISPGAANNCVPPNTIVINEIDYDQPSSDTAEFIELKNTGTAAVNLDAYSLDFINGNLGGAVSYRTFDLPNVNLAAGAYYVICGNAATVANCDLDVSPDTDLIQNGAPDAVALLRSSVIVDTVSYEGDTGAPYTEGSGVGLEDNPALANRGISRCPDGADSNVNNVDFALQAITPGAANDCPSPLVISEIDYDQPSTDTAEFIELKNVSASAVNLDLYNLVFVNGAGVVIYDTIDLPNVNLAAGAYYVICANAATVANCDLDDGPDTDFIQNGAPDAVALRLGTSVVDTVSYEGDVPGYTEGSGVGLTDTGAGVQSLSRCPDGNDTNQNNVDFLLRAITPGAANDCPPPAVLKEIYEIQGAGHSSPYNGLPVTTQDNIVTAVTGNGFWMQTPDSRADASADTANGIFVFTGSAPTVAVGQQVDVTGVVDEFQPGAPADANLSITEISAPVVTIDSAGHALPTPVIIGNGGRVPPTTVIEDDSFTSFDTASDGIDFYESLEAMRVQVNDAQVVGANNNFNEVWVVGDLGANAGLLTPRGGINIAPGDFNPERIQLDDTLYPGGSAAWPQVDVGAVLTSPAIGVVHYGFGNFEVLVTETFTVDATNAVQREVTALAGSQFEVTIATFNVENLGGNAPAAAFASRADQIVNHLGSPDILVLEEIQDNNGPTNDGTVDATLTFTNLIAAIQTAGGPAYSFAQINPQNGTDGGQPGGNIRVGFLYNASRVSFSERPGGTATTANAVVCTAGTPALAYSPGRIDPTNTAFTNSRKPLAGEFTFNGETIFIVGLHFNSKGGDQPLFGNNQPPILNSEVQRLQQATVVNGFINDLVACDPDANIVVLGDVNDFQFSAPVAVLAGDDLVNLMSLLPANEQYSYVFDGNSQVLDQILVSHNMFNTMAPAYDVVHINSEFNDQVSDHDPSVARFEMGLLFVDLDIRPGSARNVINLRSRGRVPVAILSTPDFDAPAAVDVTTVLLAGAPVATKRNGDLWVKVRDVNRDGLADLVLRFNIQALDLHPGDTEAVLTGQLFDGHFITGVDSVTIVGHHRPELIESDDADEVLAGGTWTAQATPRASGDSYLYSSGDPDDTLSFEFEGTRLTVIYVTDPAFGAFTIFIDDVAVRTVFTDSHRTHFNRRTTINYLVSEVHTVEIVPSGTVGIDAFIVQD